MEILEPGWNPGGLPDKLDSRDFQYAPKAGVPFDWTAGFDIESIVGKLPVKNQNGSGSCGGQAWSQYAGVLEAVATGSYEERSAKFIYAQTFVAGGGSMGRDNCQIVVKQGAARESVLSSYDNGQPASEAFYERPQDITAAAREDASHAKELSYWNVPTTIDSVAEAMKDGHGVILLVRGTNNGTWRTPFPKAELPSEWGHWVYCGKAKLINGKKYIGFINSWGEEVGDKGWQWFSEDWFVPGLITQAWVMLFDSKSAQPELPKPKFTHTFTRDLHAGETSDEVRALQTALNNDGATPPLPVTGFYGDLTRQAVLAFQTKYSVGSAWERKFLNGTIVGPKTRAKLNSLFSPQRSQP